MNEYQQTFYPIFGASCAIAVIAAFIAARKSGFVIPGFLLFMGVVSFWAGLFIGSDMGYRKWQSIPNPPPEAFSDTFPLGVLIFGWLPAGLFCGVIFGFFRLAGYVVSGGEHRSVVDQPDTLVESRLERVETGNPYQGPQSLDDE